MNRIPKTKTSRVLSENLRYREGRDNSLLKEILSEEQGYFCAYTQKPLEQSNPGEIEHFNPHLKNTKDDHYENWLIAESYWNKLKGNKWVEPVLWPHAEDFEERILMIKWEYIARNADDQAALNLIELVNLNHPKLAHERENYYLSLMSLQLKKSELVEYFRDPLTIFKFIRMFKVHFQFTNEDLHALHRLRQEPREPG